ncbi:hypothetical protein [Aquibacillus salsiterrae]|uniref:Uncharacterized protein n=1 Tax=Aquibacillus salsiterrae TaxID=2950439 RepID=A0A9X3WE29_9BACI|nr:hypothetical protein [Aquibacillus salsiterrae]MDC3416766.1 hypothetical protein [Aquibacillus salsiterrae]
MRGRRRKVRLNPLIICFILVLIIPLIISITYGNIPFYNNDYLVNYDILVSNDKKLNESDISFINYNTYTWPEIKSYIIRNQMTYSHILRDMIILIAIAVLAIIIDRTFGQRRSSIRRK